MIALPTQHTERFAQDNIQPAPRTLAQREAARINGAKSRGPKTAAGKARSRANALKHGLTARLLTPAANVKGDDQNFLAIRAQLLDEFKPRDATARMTIDCLARAYVKLARAAELGEAVYAAPVRDKRESERWDRLQTLRKELDRVDQAINRFDAESFTGLPLKLARQIAKLLVRDVQGVIDYIEDPDGSPPEDMDADELEEYRAEESVYKLIRASRKRLSDIPDLVALLHGDRTPRRGEMKRIRRLLDRAKARRDEVISIHTEVEGWLLSGHKQHVQRLAFDTRPLERVARYERQIQREIDQLHARLRQA